MKWDRKSSWKSSEGKWFKYKFHEGSAIEMIYIVEFYNEEWLGNGYRPTLSFIAFDKGGGGKYHEHTRFQLDNYEPYSPKLSDFREAIRLMFREIP
jgi:hypothetical protein